VFAPSTDIPFRFHYITIWSPATPSWPGLVARSAVAIRRGWCRVALAPLLIANVNLGADLGSMGDVAHAGSGRPTRTAAQEADRGARAGTAAFEHIGLDTWIGMALSNLVALVIMLTAGATLHVAGKTDIDISQMAAEAPRPLAGELALHIFALGVGGLCRVCRW